MALRESPTIPNPRRDLDRLAAQEFHLVPDGSEAGIRPFKVRSEVTLGKAPDNDVVLDHPSVSRRHALIVRQGERFVVRDLGSTNGTYIDGAQVKEGYLRPGAVLKVGDLKFRFQSSHAPIQIEAVSTDRLADLVGKSVAMRQIFALIERIAPTESTLLIQGETGSGKGAAAKAIHKLSRRASGPLVIFDCAAVSDSLIESELFGHEKGAFTGAVTQRIGCLERANGGTLFLDEIDDLRLDLQPKLLRAIEDREFARLGSSSQVGFDTRIIAASKKELWSETAAGRFREDLYFRLSVFTVGLPPLRDRKEDIPLLADAFADERLWSRLPEATRDQFISHTWPGNVRELRNAVERARHLEDIPGMNAESLLKDVSGLSGISMAAGAAKGDSVPVTFLGPFKARKDEMVRSFEREYLLRLLARSKGNVAKAAREAELDRKHLYLLLHKHGLAPNDGD